MALRDLDIRMSYKSLSSNGEVVKDFYLPVLRYATTYKRAVGYFNSSALTEIAVGLQHFVENGGKMQLIVSPHLEEEDLKAIIAGHERREEVIARVIMKGIEEPASIIQMKKLDLLANLIAEGILEIKVAFVFDGKSSGMYHEKIGFFQDPDGNKIAFTGSMNETYAGMRNNWESIDVYCSWKEHDVDRVTQKETEFEMLWSGLRDAVEVLEFPKVALDKIKTYKRESIETLVSDPEVNIPQVPVIEIPEGDFFTMPSGFDLHDYQTEAVDAWMANGSRGIFDMATGTGKTYTGLGAVTRLSNKIEDKLGVIIVAPYIHLVDQWVEDIRLFNVEPLVCHSANDWKSKFTALIRDFRFGYKNNFCMICCNASFATDFVQSEIEKLRNSKNPLCLIIDETHNFGSEKYRKLLKPLYTYRLGLSATVERHHDEEGTSALRNFFGKTCILYSLERAIKEDKLTPYYYYPVIIYLDAEERKEYNDLSKQIGKIMHSRKDKSEMPKAAEILLLKRARLIAGTKGKLTALYDIMKNKKSEANILVYCGATRVSDVKYKEDMESEADDQRQIEAVLKMLGNDIGLRVAKFTSDENAAERERIKRNFKDGDIQAVVAIKCLDEGVNIPSIVTAFILASSTNPKEYIQRRGRVLRKLNGKHFAHIYDFITLPRPMEDDLDPETAGYELSLVKRELERVKDFANISLNPAESVIIRDMIEEYYQMNYIKGGKDEY
jgi:superfamily II DNA or RNA helicase